MNPAKIQGMMKKMGIAQNELPVRRVIFELEDKKMIFEDPQVLKVTMGGNAMYQVTGESIEESVELFSDSDVKLVASKSGKSEDKAREALQKSNGDIAEAIMALK